MSSDSGVDFSRLKGNLLDFKAYVADNKSIRMLKSAIEKLKVDSEVYVKELDKNESMLFVAFEQDKEHRGCCREDGRLTEIDLHAKYLDAKPDKIIKSRHLQNKENRQKLAEHEQGTREDKRRELFKASFNDRASQRARSVGGFSDVQEDRHHNSD